MSFDELYLDLVDIAQRQHNAYLLTVLETFKIAASFFAALPVYQNRLVLQAAAADVRKAWMVAYGS